MPFCAPPDLERNKISHPNPEQDRSSLSSWRDLWAKMQNIATSFLRSESASTAPKGITSREGPLLSLRERATKCMFLCLSGSKGAYAIVIPCLRSSPRRQIGQRLEKQHGRLRFIPGGEIYEQPVIAMEAFEDDATIWRRMIQAHFNHNGLWKQWLPFYGPIVVREVKFQFVGTEDRNMTFEIFDLTPVNEERLREKADQTIASVPNEIDIEYGDGCLGFSHGTKCPASLNDDLRCILDMAEEAHLRKRKLDMLFLLKDCARNPQKANGRNTLEGMAQESCIYDLQSIEHNLPRLNQPHTQRDQIRGIEIESGWQFDRIASELPLTILWTWFCLVVIWSAVILWKGETNDWGGAMAFGQLVAASLSFIVIHTKV